MLVIAPNNMHSDIIKYYRKDNPFFDIKLVSKTDLLLASKDAVKDDALIYLMSEYHYSYDESELYLRYIPFLNGTSTSKKEEHLLKLKADLKSKGYLKENLPLRYLYQNKKAVVIGYSKEDKELLEYGRCLNLSLEWFNYVNELPHFEINKFVRLEDEVYYALNEIAHELDLGVDINDIIIFYRDSAYDYYLNKFSPSFGYRINLDNSSSWFETGVGVEFFKLFHKTHDVSASIEALKEICLEDDLYLNFIEYMDRLVIPETTYEILDEYLKHKLSSTKAINTKYKPAIRVISDATLLENKHVYILGFAQSIFPLTRKDDHYLDKKEIEKLHLLTSKDNTKFDQENIINFLKLDNQYHISISEKSLANDAIYPSPLLKEMDVNFVSDPFKNYFYSEKVLGYIACEQKDYQYYYQEYRQKYYQTLGVVNLPYHTYSNEFNGVDVYNSTSFLNLSSHALEDYFTCPFRYYLNRRLQVDPFEINESIILGNIVHQLLEEYYLDPTYNISDNFDKLVIDNDIPLEKKIIWKYTLKDQIVNMVNYVYKQNDFMTNPTFKMEIALQTKLDKNTMVNGRMDKVIFLDNKYMAAVDYKTGTSGNFMPDCLEFGYSVQIPTYAYLLEENYKDYQLGGLYIHHIISNEKNITVKENKIIPDYLYLVGKSLLDLDYVSKFDSSISGGKSNFLKGVELKGEAIKPSSTTASENDFKDYIKQVKEKYLEAAKLIRENKFNIHPLIIANKTKLKCEYCSYKDICFVRDEQINSQVIKKEEKVSE